MQTFLPYASYRESARCLDNKRLGKQRVEVLQILNALNNPDNGWRNHPAVKMWRGHEESLVYYGLTICCEWRARGFKDTCFDKILATEVPRFTFSKPPWFGKVDFHSRHRAALLAKNPEWYSRFDWDEEPGIGYIWPKGVENES